MAVDQDRIRVFHFCQSICYIIVLFQSVIFESRYAVHGADLYPFGDHSSALDPGSSKTIKVLARPLILPDSSWENARIHRRGTFRLINDDPDIFKGFTGTIAPSDSTAATSTTFLETTDYAIMEKFESDIVVMDRKFNIDWALIVTWFELPKSGAVNTYQIVLAAGNSTTNGTRVYAIFNYNTVQWADTRLGGIFYPDEKKRDRLPCLEGGCALAGYTDFANQVFNKSNIGVPGRYVMRLDGEMPVICNGANDPIINVVGGTVTIEGNYVQTTDVDTIVLKCIEHTRDPAITKVWMGCGIVTDEADGNELTLSVDVYKGLDNELCECHVESRDGLYFSNSSINLIVHHPPENAPQITINSNNNNNRILTDQSVITETAGNEVKIGCSVEGGTPDVSKVMLHCGNENIETDGTNTSMTFTLDSGWHREMCACRAAHVTGRYDLVSTFTFDVQYPPIKAPITMIDNSIVENGDVVNKTTGDQIDVRCTVEGGNPETSSVTLQCGSDVEETGGTEASMTLTLDREWHQGMCSCYAEHITGDYHLTSNFTFNVHYPPLKAPMITINNNISHTIASGDTVTTVAGEDVDIACVVEGGNPNVSKVMIWCGNEEHWADGAAITTALRMDRSWDKMNCLCRAEHVTGGYDKITTFDLSVQYPPIARPELSVNNGFTLPNGTYVVKPLESETKVVCKVEGGSPEVRQVTLQCGNETKVTNGTETSMTLTLHKEWHQKTCECHAEHMTGDYDSMSAFTFRLKGEAHSASMSTERIIILSGSISGGVIVILVIITCVYIIGRSKDPQGIKSPNKKKFQEANGRQSKEGSAKLPPSKIYYPTPIFHR